MQLEVNFNFKEEVDYAEAKFQAENFQKNILKI